MDAAISLFSLIDIIGILLPGGLLAVCVCYFWFDMMLPVNELFADNSFMLTTCFFGLSFIFGSALHTLGSLLESLLGKVFKGGETTAIERAAYQNLLGKNSPKNKREYMKDVFAYVQRDTRPPLIVMFTAYSTMSRNLTVALSMAAFIVWRSGIRNQTLYLVLIGILIFIVRWSHFDNLRIRAASAIFVADAAKKEK